MQRPPTGPLEHGEAFFPLYPPQTAMFCAPFAVFSYATAVWLWMSLFLLCVAVAIAMLVRGSPVIANNWNILLLAGAAFPPLYVGLYVGQLSGVLLLILAAGTVEFLRGRDIWAGIVLGCLCLKPPFVVAAVLWACLARRWSLLWGLFGSAIAMAGVTAICLEWSVFASYLDSVYLYSKLGTIYRFTVAHQHGLGGVLVGAFSREHARECLFAHVALVFGAVGIRQLRVQRAKMSRGSAETAETASQQQCRFRDVVFLGCLLVLVTPHLLTYDLVLVLVPFLVVFSRSGAAAWEPEVQMGVGLLALGAMIWPLYGLTGISLFPFLALYSLCRFV